MSFGQRLSKMRNHFHISQEVLAKQLGVTRQAVSKWESGASLPDVEMIIRICQALHVTPNQLLSGDDDVPMNLQNSGGTVKYISYITSAIFPSVVFLCGIVIIIFNFFVGKTYEPKLTALAVLLLVLAVTIFIVSNLYFIWKKSPKHRKIKKRNS